MTENPPQKKKQRKWGWMVQRPGNWSITKWLKIIWKTKNNRFHKFTQSQCLIAPNSHSSFAHLKLFIYFFICRKLSFLWYFFFATLKSNDLISVKLMNSIRYARINKFKWKWKWKRKMIKFEIETIEMHF